MPRPTRVRACEEPGLSVRSLSFMLSSQAVNDAHEMRDLGDHAARGGRIEDGAAPANLVEAETDQGLALVDPAPDGADRLFERDHFGCRRHDGLPDHESDASASTPTRRDCSVDTLMLRRWATARGLSS